MTETVAIIISTLGACGAFGAGVCKYYTERDETPHETVVENRDVIHHVPHNTPVPNFEELIAQQMEQRDSDTSTDIEIKINIHTVIHDLKEANDGKHYK